MCTADLTHTYESPHLKRQRITGGGQNASLWVSNTLKVWDQRQLLSDIWLGLLGLGNVLYGIRPCVTPAWLLYTQTGRDVTLWAPPPPVKVTVHHQLKATGGAEQAIMHHWGGNGEEQRGGGCVMHPPPPQQVQAGGGGRSTQIGSFST